MVIDYTIEYISTANSKISLKVCSLIIYFIILIPYLLVKLPYLIPTPSYNRFKNFFHRRLYSKILESPKYGGHFIFLTSLWIRLIVFSSARSKFEVWRSIVDYCWWSVNKVRMRTVHLLKQSLFFCFSLH